jgi:Holliday junction resolvase
MAGKSSRRKGFSFEREVVNQFKEAGIPAKRAYGSNGASMGMHPEVDVVAGEKTFQLKRTKSVAAKYKPSDAVYGQIFREDRGESYVLIRLKDYIELAGADDA